MNWFFGANLGYIFILYELCSMMMMLMMINVKIKHIFIMIVYILLIIIAHHVV